jgi:hypothetical protein
MKHVNNLYLAILVVVITVYYKADMQIIIIPLTIFVFIFFVINDVIKNKRVKKETINEFSSRIEGILVSLREVWDEYQEVAKDVYQQKRVVVATNPLHTVPAEFRTPLPADWEWKVSRLYPIPLVFLKDERVQIDKFCCNIIDIISLYSQIQGLGGGNYDADAFSKLRNRWETLLFKVIEKGNPLKKHNNRIHADTQ